MSFSGFVQIMINPDNALLAVIIVCAGLRRTEKQERAGESGSYEQRFFEQRKFHAMSHKYFSLRFQPNERRELQLSGRSRRTV
jgi:hypothetical protein